MALEVYNKNWTDFKDIIDNNSLYYDYEETSLSIVRIFTTRNSNVAYRTSLTIIDSQDESYPGSDYEDWVDNYKSGAGEKTYVYDSWSFNADLVQSETINDHVLKDEWDSANVKAYIYKGFVSVNSTAQRGDVIEVTIHDGTDDVGVLIKHLELDGGLQRIPIQPPQYDQFPSKKVIPSGYSIRVKYKNSIASGAVNVIVGAEYEH